MVKLKLLSNVSFGKNKDGEEQDYKAGQVIDGISDKEAEKLIDLGAAEEVQEVQNVDLTPPEDPNTPPQE